MNEGSIRPVVAAFVLAAFSAMPQPQAAVGRTEGQQQTQGSAVSLPSAGKLPDKGITARGGRRDLFAPPPGVATGGTAAGGAAVLLPPMPLPESAGPTVPPASLPALPAQGQGSGVQAPPVSLRGIVLGTAPQAVLASGGAYKIVAVGQETPWGIVRSITATTVTFETSAGTPTLTFEAKPAITNSTKPGSSR